MWAGASALTGNSSYEEVFRNIPEEVKKGGITMCHIAEGLKSQGRVEGRVEGRAEGLKLAFVVSSTYKETGSVFAAAAKASITEEEAREILAGLGIEVEHRS